MIAILLWFLHSSTAQAAPPKGTICTLTLNSADERNAFIQSLSSKGFKFPELVPGAPGYIGGDEAGASPDWFKSSCKMLHERKIHCDALVVSGHFGGTFFGSSGRTLSLEELEAASCSKECEEVLSDPKAVYLFGCNTLSGKEPDQRTPEQYRMDLIADGYPVDQAERIAEERYGPTGNTNRERMVRVFKHSPRIYGFHSIGPKGARVKGMLADFFKKEPDYAVFLKKLSIERAQREILDPLKRSSLAKNDGFLSCLKCTAITCANGICDGNPEIADQLCELRNEENPVSSRLGALDTLLRAKGGLAYIPTAVAVLEKLDEKKLTEEDKRQLEAIKKNEELKKSLLDLIKDEKLNLYSQKVKWIELASRLSWLDRDAEKASYLAVAKGLAKGFAEQGNRDTLYSLSFSRLGEALKGDRELALLLLEHLKNPDRTIQSGVISLINWIRPKDTGISLALVESMKALPDPDLKREVGQTLGRINPTDPGVARALSALLSEGDATVRASAAYVLGVIRTRDSGTVQGLAKLLKDSDPNVRSSAIYALRAIAPQDPAIKRMVKEAGVEPGW